MGHAKKTLKSEKHISLSGEPPEERRNTRQKKARLPSSSIKGMEEKGET